MSEEVVKEEVILPKESQSLTDVKGVGPKTAQKLVDAGVTTKEQLACMRPDELADIMGITKKAAKDIINDAISQALETAVVVKSMQDSIDHRRDVMKRIPTGSAKWDAIIKGGIPTEAITIFKGEYASGKTQVCYQLAVNTMKYFKRKVAWIETESGTFVPDRLLEMGKAIGLTIDTKNGVLYVDSSQIATPWNLFLAYQRIAAEIEIKGLDVGLLVIDSFSAPFRTAFGDRAQLPDRSKEEGRHLGLLNHLSRKYNMAIVLTCQVMDIPDAGMQLAEKMKSGHTKKMVGGKIVEHGGTYLISLQQVAGREWEAVIFDSPDVPKTATRFVIKECGIRDI